MLLTLSGWYFVGWLMFMCCRSYYWHIAMCYNLQVYSYAFVHLTATGVAKKFYRYLVFKIQNIVQEDLIFSSARLAWFFSINEFVIAKEKVRKVPPSTAFADAQNFDQISLNVSIINNRRTISLSKNCLRQMSNTMIFF